MITRILSSCANLGRQAKQHLKQWTRPATVTLVTGALSDTTRSRAHLIAENLMLRQQLIVLKRQVKRPQLTNGDRLRLVLLARCTQFWQQALLIVQPDTLLRWHRDLFRRYWRHKSRHKKRQPRLPPETIALIRKIAKENRLWGAERICGELLKHGNASTTCSSCIPISCTASSGRAWITTTTPDPIRALGSACPLDSPGAIPHHRAKSSLYRCWVVYTMPIPVRPICIDI
jgi:hypothetical protein